MKIKGRKYGAASIVLYFGTVVICVCILMVLWNYQKKSDLEQQSRGFCSEFAQSFQVFGDVSENEFKKELKENVSNGIVYITGLNPNGTLRSVWYQGAVKIPEMKQGRFFGKSDFDSDEKVAVIGAGCLSEVTEKNGLNYIEIEGQDFEVIGVISAGENTRLGQMKFINQNAAFQIFGISGSYILDSENEKTVQEQMSDLSWVLGDDNIYYSKGVEEVESAVRVFGLETLDAIYIIMLLNFLGCGVFIAIYWLYRKREYLAVYKLLGLSRLRVFGDVLLDYVGIVFCGAVSGLLFFYITRLLY